MVLPALCRKPRNRAASSRAPIETGDVELAVHQLLDTFDVDEGRLLTDLDDLVTELISAGLLEAVDS